MKTNTYLILAAAAAVLFVLSKRNSPGTTPAAPGRAAQPPGVPTLQLQTTTGPNGTAPTIIQQLGGAPGIGDGVNALSNAVGNIWDRIQASNDTPPATDGTGDWQPADTTLGMA